MIFCMIIKDEYPWYVEEWMEYYSPLGRVVIYDNNDVSGTMDAVLGRFKEAVVVPFPGRPVQLKAYMDCCGRYPDEVILFIDADEFWVRNKTIEEYEQLCRNYGALAFNWQVYGSSGLKEADHRPQAVKFIYKKPWNSPVNKHIKTMVVGKNVRYWVNPHQVELRSGQYQRRVFSGTSPIIDLSMGYINHYFTRSQEEFKQKIEKGRADLIGTRYMSEFHDMDYDATILGGIEYANL